MTRVVLPQHLRTLASVDREIQLDVKPPITQRSVLDALESKYPMLSGTIRDQSTKQRRALVRFFACQEDLSHESPDTPLPEKVASGQEPYIILGAIAGGPLLFHTANDLLCSSAIQKCSSRASLTSDGSPTALNSTSALGPGTS